MINSRNPELIRRKWSGLVRVKRALAGRFHATNARPNLRLRLALLWLLPVSLLGQGPLLLPDEELKALFILNFGRYVEWPEEGSSPKAFVIGIVGRTRLKSVLEETVRNKLVGGLPVVIRQVVDPADIDGCRIVYFCPRPAGRQEPFFSAMSGRAILTVGEGERFAELGGMIGFSDRDRKLALNVNLPAVRGAQLKISSRLLAVAEVTPQQLIGESPP